MKKRFGQHFLSDPSILRRIVQFAEIRPEDTVLEIGPGAGSLTRELARAARRVIAVEIDKDLISQLRAGMPENVEIIEGDALTVEFPSGPVRLVGNLPYNVATPLFKKFIEHYPQYKGKHADENNDVIFGWLRERHMSPIFSNLCLAFEATALEGRLWLSPSAISAGKESETYGTQHHNFDRLIQPQRRNADDGLSADDFLQAHKDVLADKRVPPLVLAREAKANATASYFHQTETVTASSGSTKVLDYPQLQHGVPPQSEKYSFRKLVDSMSSTQLAQRCQQDPAFKKALDEME